MRARPNELKPLAHAADAAAGKPVLVRELGRIEYEHAWRAQQAFTATRDGKTVDEIWLLEHPAVYTVGRKGRTRRLPSALGIPLIHSDRGGDLTYHGPGQLVVYVLMDLQRRGLGVHALVSRLEQAVIDFLAAHALQAHRRAGAPGVYVEGRKLAALGLRVQRGCSYHGLALNVDLDLRPFTAIDPCGYSGLEVTRLADLGLALSVSGAGTCFLPHLARALGYGEYRTEPWPLERSTLWQAGRN